MHFDYEGIDRTGSRVRGSTTGDSEKEVAEQLKAFGFSEIRVSEGVAPTVPIEKPSTAEASADDDSVRDPAGVDMEAAEDYDDELAEQEEWRRLDVLAKVRSYRRKENIAMAIAVVLVGAVVAFFLFDKTTEVRAPQPRIIMRSNSEMLSFKDVYVSGDNLIVVIYARNWNGNVRVDFRAWDPFDNVADWGAARLGYIGDHFGGAPEKSGAFKLKKTRFYDTIEVRVRGDEGK